MVTTRKQGTHQLSETKSSLSGDKGVPGPLLELHSSHTHRQHNSGYLCKRRRGNEVRPSECPIVENPDLVYQETGDSQSSTHPRLAECDSRKAIQARPDHSDRMVSSPRGVSNSVQPVAPAPSGSVCHQVQQQTTTVCLAGSRPTGLGSGCPQPIVERSGSIRLPTSHHLGQSGVEVAGLPMQQSNFDCPRVALVLGPGSHVQSDPVVPAHPAQFTDSAIQPHPSQESGEPESS